MIDRKGDDSWLGVPELLAGLQDAVLIEDETRHVVFANAAFAELFLGGAPPEVMIGVDCGAAARQSAEAFVDVSAWIEDTESAVNRRQVIRGQLWQMATGRWVERDYVPRFAGERFLGHCWIYRDVTEREGMRQKIVDLESDLQIAQRPAFSARTHAAESTVWAIESALRDGAVTVAIAKIENLDLVNAALGHGAGDELLESLPSRIRRELPGCHVERLGGSAFGVVCRTAPHETIAGIHEAVGLTVSGRGRSAMVNVLVGAVGSDDGAMDGRTRLQNARMALREARRQGADVVLDAESVAATLHRDGLGLALPGAIQDGELRMVYQPVVRLTDRERVGYESLVRWDRPSRGTIAAASFVPAAETLGLAPRIDEWVIDRVVKEVADASALDGLTVGLNVSGRTLNTPGWLVPLILDALDRYHVSPSRLVMEVTESAVAEHTRPGLDAMHQLAQAGIRIAIDDFGVGSSSLATLRDVPFRYLKLDKQFARGIEDQRVQTLVTVTTSMAADLGANVVAEGIEQEDQAERMQACGVQLGQGWLLGMPS